MMEGEHSVLSGITLLEFDDVLMSVPAAAVHRHKGNSAFDEAPSQQTALADAASAIAAVTISDALWFVGQFESTLCGGRRDQVVGSFEIRIGFARSRGVFGATEFIERIHDLSAAIEACEVQTSVEVEVANFEIGTLGIATNGKRLSGAWQETVAAHIPTEFGNGDVGRKNARLFSHLGKTLLQMSGTPTRARACSPSSSSACRSCARQVERSSIG